MKFSLLLLLVMMSFILLASCSVTTQIRCDEQVYITAEDTSTEKDKLTLTCGTRILREELCDKLSISCDEVTCFAVCKKGHKTITFKPAKGTGSTYE